MDPWEMQHMGAAQAPRTRINERAPGGLMVPHGRRAAPSWGPSSDSLGCNRAAQRLATLKLGGPAVT